MATFLDTSISEMDARIRFLNFLARKGLKIEKEFLNPKVNIYRGRIPNTLAQGTANLNNRSINFASSPQIVTYWHELGHYFSAWKDTDGHIYSDYEYEKDFTAQFGESKSEPGFLDVKRGIHGRFWGEAAAEYRASEMAWEFDSNNKNKYFRTQNRTFYDEEIITMRTIARVLDLTDNEMFYKSNKDNAARKFMQTRTKNLTGSENNWTILEHYLDYIEIEKCGKISMVGQPVLPGGRIAKGFSSQARKNFEKMRKAIPEHLTAMLNSRKLRNNISLDKYNTISEEIKKLEEILNSRNRTHV